MADESPIWAARLRPESLPKESITRDVPCKEQVEQAAATPDVLLPSPNNTSSLQLRVLGEIQLPPCFGLQSSSTSERGAISSATGCELRESLPESREVDRNEGEGSVPATPSPEITTSARRQPARQRLRTVRPSGVGCAGGVRDRGEAHGLQADIAVHEAVRL